MARITLRYECVAQSPAGSGFTRTEIYWDTVARNEGRQTGAQVACQNTELLVGQEVDQWCEVDGTRVTVLYKGGLGYSPGNNNTGLRYEPNAPACPLPTAFTLGHPRLTHPTTPASRDGRVEVTYYTPHPGVTGVLSTAAAAPANVATGLGTLVFDNLPGGRFSLVVEDAAGAVRTLTDLVLTPAATGGLVWLYWTVSEDLDQDGNWLGTYSTSGTLWDRATRQVLAYTTAAPVAGAPPVPETPAPGTGSVTNGWPLGVEVDSYFLAGGVTFRRVFHDGVGGVLFSDQTQTPGPDPGGLRFANAVVQHVHRPAAGSGAGLGAAVGSVLLEATGAAAATAGGFLPGLTYTHLATGEQNPDGRFHDLAPGPHRFRVQDAAGQSAEHSVTVEDRYRLRFYLSSRAPDGTAVYAAIFGRDYAGAAEEVRGTGAEAVERTWEGGGADLQGVLPEAAGQQCRLSLRQAYAGQFAPLFAGDDRAHRVDVHAGGQLRFRGYVLPDLYSEDLVRADGGAVTVSAADGLGVLRDTAFLNHDALPLAGRWPLLHTLLHCLSRCECGPLPLHVQVDLTEALMQPADALLAAVHADRGAYREADRDGQPGREWHCRQVVEAVLRPLHAVLFQRAGAWWAVSANNAGRADVPVRAYAPNGRPVPAPAAPPAVRLLPPDFATGQLRWVQAAQRVDTLAAARAAQARVGLRLVANQLPDGLLQTWQADLRRPLGWSGTLDVERLDLDARAGDKNARAGRTKLRAAWQQPPGAKLVSPVAFYLRPGADESPVRVRLRVRAVARPAANTAADARVLLRVQATVGGAAAGAPLQWEIGTDENEVTVEAFAPFGAAAAAGPWRLEVLPLAYAGPAVVVPPRPAVDLEVYEVGVQVLPGAVDWPDQDEVTALNESGFLVLPAVELAHADVPRLRPAGGAQPAAPRTDAAAWRHAWTYADGVPTAAWRRGTSRAPLPLLESAAADRLEVRAAPVTVLRGPVRGPAALALGFGSVVDVPADAPGLRFWAVGATVRDLAGVAELTLREIGEADPLPLPANRLVQHTGYPIFTDLGHPLGYE